MLDFSSEQDDLIDAGSIAATGNPAALIFKHRLERMVQMETALSAAPLSVYFCGTEKCEPGHFFGPAVRPHYLIHFVLRGKGMYRTAQRSFFLEGGQAFLIRPGETTYYEADSSEPWEYSWLAFDGPEAERLLREYGLDREPVCRFQPVAWVESLFGQVIPAFESGRFCPESMTGWFYLIYSCIVRQAPVPEPEVPGEELYFRSALSYIRNNFGYPITVTDIAQFVGIDRTYLYRIFRNRCGKSPKEYLTEYRIRISQEMLQHREYSVTEIAFSCGFHDSSTFCKSFRRTVGTSPLAYRKNKTGEACTPDQI